MAFGPDTSNACAERFTWGGSTVEAETLALAPEDEELVRVVHFAGEHGRHECRRIVGLQPGRLVREQGICSGVGPVEPVLGEFLHEIEDAGGDARRDTAPRGALEEDGALLRHLLGLLLAHGAAQEVGAAERVAGQDLGDLHHLLLVDDHPVGAPQHRLEVGVQVVDDGAGAGSGVLARDEVVDHARTAADPDGRAPRGPRGRRSDRA